jgi:hypothetical protein
MKKWRFSRVYGWGESDFKFVGGNSRTKEFIVCPCTKCCLGKTLWEDFVYNHLTSGVGILESYTKCIMHGKTIIASVNKEPIYEGNITALIDSMTIHGGSSGM